jgi:hypothetical protein
MKHSKMHGDGGHGVHVNSVKLHKGLKTREPSPPDGKITKMSGSVNSESTRKETAPTPKTIGPREA